MNPERAHHKAMSALGWLANSPGLMRMLLGVEQRSETTVVKLAGLDFGNRFGLAAGFDKDGQYLQALSKLPFGHIEVGTVTPKPQSGNPKPRLFRLPKDQALINRMGFNNEGVEALVKRLLAFDKPKGLVLGGNIGKNKATPQEEAVDDYVYCFERLHDHVDYFTINVSSPNTPGLRSLQAYEPLNELLGMLQLSNSMKSQPKPLFLKIAPDLKENELEDIAKLCQEHQLAGLITTNTTISREGLQTPGTILSDIGSGGLSGAPLFDRSTEVLHMMRTWLPRPFVLIGAGGISSQAHAQMKLDAGADMVQVYTGFIYQGIPLLNDLSRL